MFQLKASKMNRAKEIQETIEKLEENHRTEVATLKEELKDIRRRCKHTNKCVVAADKGYCDDCGDSVWLK